MGAWAADSRTAKLSTPGARPIARLANNGVALAIAVLVVAVALSLAATPQADVLFVGLVEDVVGPAAVALLNALGSPAEFAGNVISDPAGTTAVTVTRACDGHGLMAVLLGMLLGWTARTTSWRRVAFAFLVGVVLIIGFNIARIAALFFFRGGAEAAYEVTHDVVFAIASVWLIGMIVALAESAGPRQEPFVTKREMLRLAPALLVASAIWIAFGNWSVDRGFTPILNHALRLFGPAGIGEVDSATGLPFVNTMLVAERSPLGLLSQLFDPVAFFLPIPIAVAAIVVATRRFASAPLVVLVVTIAGLAAASLAVISAVAHEAERLQITEMAVLVGPQEVRLERSSFPGTGTAAILDRVRNVIVHVNLFVLPLLVFPLARRTTRRWPRNPEEVSTRGQPIGAGGRGPRPRIEPI